MDGELGSIAQKKLNWPHLCLSRRKVPKLCFPMSNSHSTNVTSGSQSGDSCCYATSHMYQLMTWYTPACDLVTAYLVIRIHIGH